MSEVVRTPRGWTLIYTTTGGWVSNEIGLVDSPRTYAGTRIAWAKVSEYPGYYQSLVQAKDDPTVWFLLVSYTPDGGETYTDTYAYKQTSSVRPQFPADFSGPLWPWIAVVGGITLLNVYITYATSGKSRRHKRSR